MCLLFVTHACFSFSLFFYNNSLIVFLSLTIPVLFLLYIYILLYLFPLSFYWFLFINKYIWYPSNFALLVVFSPSLLSSFLFFWFNFSSDSWYLRYASRIYFLSFLSTLSPYLSFLSLLNSLLFPSFLFILALFRVFSPFWSFFK